MITTKEKLLIFMVLLIAIIFTIFTVIKRENQRELSVKYQMIAGENNKIEKQILVEAITDALENGNMNFNHIYRENSECWDTLEKNKT